MLSFSTSIFRFRDGPINHVCFFENPAISFLFTIDVNFKQQYLFFTPDIVFMLRTEAYTTVKNFCPVELCLLWTKWCWNASNQKFLQFWTQRKIFLYQLMPSLSSPLSFLKIQLLFRLDINQVLTPSDPSSRNGWFFNVSGLAFQTPTAVMKHRADPVNILSHLFIVLESWKKIKK